MTLLRIVKTGRAAREVSVPRPSRDRFHWLLIGRNSDLSAGSIESLRPPLAVLRRTWGRALSGFSVDPKQKYLLRPDGRPTAFQSVTIRACLAAAAACVRFTTPSALKMAVM